MHYVLTHVFEHVKRKGSTKVMNTIISKHGHIWLKADAVQTYLVSLKKQVSSNYNDKSANLNEHIWRLS
jgi:hypothetical protein